MAKLLIYFGRIVVHMILERKEERLKRRKSNLVPGGIGRPMKSKAKSYKSTGNATTYTS